MKLVFGFENEHFGPNLVIPFYNTSQSSTLMPPKPLDILKKGLAEFSKKTKHKNMIYCNKVRAFVCLINKGALRSMHDVLVSLFVIVRS